MAYLSILNTHSFRKIVKEVNMKQAASTQDEAARIQTLQSYQVLDTALEDDYDDLTRLISSICDTPIALISLIDEDRQWFKSRYGLSVAETARDISYCGHAIHGDDLFEVNDALNHPDFYDNPLAVSDPRVVFYAGYPLKMESGHNIGTLCVIDHVPKILNDFQRQALRTLARQVVANFELRRKNSSVNNANQRLKNLNHQLQDSQSALVEQARLATMGQISAGIAHEINNPISVIALANQKNMTATNCPELIKNGQRIHDTCIRVSETVRNLLQLSHNNSKQSVAVCNLHLLVCQAISHYEATSSHACVAVTNDVDINIEVSCVDSAVVQILLNLVANAHDAVAYLDDKWIKVSACSNHESLIVSVIDSGHGIPETAKEKVFEPFYSTKHNTGHGLGLNISANLARYQNGYIRIDDNSANTKLDLHLPATLAKVVLPKEQ